MLGRILLAACCSISLLTAAYASTRDITLVNDPAQAGLNSTNVLMYTNTFPKAISANPLCGQGWSWNEDHTVPNGHALEPAAGITAKNSCRLNIDTGLEVVYVTYMGYQAAGNDGSSRCFGMNYAIYPEYLEPNATLYIGAFDDEDLPNGVARASGSWAAVPCH